MTLGGGGIFKFFVFNGVIIVLSFWGCGRGRRIGECNVIYGYYLSDF